MFFNYLCKLDVLKIRRSLFAVVDPLTTSRSTSTQYKRKLVYYLQSAKSDARSPWYSAALNMCARKLPDIYSSPRTFGFSALGYLEGAPKGPQLATTLASPSTTLAPTPRHQRLITVGGWCDPIIQPFLSRFSSRRFCFQAFL